MVNAYFHAFQSGKLAGEIILSMKKQTQWVILNISDNGKGMSEETCLRVFEPFYTTKRNEGGTGLGMHISYNIIKQKLNGTIKCHSTLGEGSQFEITLPLIEEEKIL
jgi:signal transduction histidine kinase